MSDPALENSPTPVSEEANPPSEQQGQMNQKKALHSSLGDAKVPVEKIIVSSIQLAVTPGPLGRKKRLLGKPETTAASPEQSFSHSTEVSGAQQTGVMSENPLDPSLPLDNKATISTAIQQNSEPVETKLEHTGLPKSSSSEASETLSSRQSAPKIASSKWAPLIYGRTYEIDFRFLVMPQDFDEKFKNWIWEFIKVSTRSPENLPRKPRWIFLRTKRYCIMGVTCLVRDLLGSPEGGLEDLTRDRHGRSLYTFVGLVSQTATPSAIPAMNLELFAEHYCQLVPQKWREKYFGDSQKEISQALLSEYSWELGIEERLRFDFDRRRISFEQLFPKRVDTIVFWNIEDANNILFSTLQSPRPIYICIGNLYRKELLDSQYMSAVLDEISSRQEIEKLRRPSSKLKGNTSKSKSSKQIKQSFGGTKSNRTAPAGNELNIRTQSSRGKEDRNLLSNLSEMLPDPIRWVIQEGPESLADEITWMGETELLVHLRRLKITADEYKLQTRALEDELENLKNQERNAEVNRKLEEIKKKIEKLQDSVHQIYRREQKVSQRRAVIRGSQVSQPGWDGVQTQHDPLIGFKQRDHFLAEDSTDSEQDNQRSNDLWKL